MKQIANDEINVPFDLMQDRTPTHVLRFRDVDSGRVLLEQLWESPYVGIKAQWVPVPICKNQDEI